MKKTILFIVSIVLIICAILLSKYYMSKEIKEQIVQFNLKYEMYSKKEEIFGRDIATLINQAVDDNELNRYKENTEEINIQIKITEFKEEQIYEMKTLYGGGMNDFVKYYGQIPFKCIDTQYGENGQIRYLLFEQIND